jgi:hypothetical protein
MSYLKLCSIFFFCIFLVTARPKDDGDIGRDVEPDGDRNPARPIMTRSPTASPSEAPTNNPTISPTKAPTHVIGRVIGDGHAPPGIGPTNSDSQGKPSALG